eukprot:3436007-Amphidinium_carterae.1
MTMFFRVQKEHYSSSTSLIHTSLQLHALRLSNRSNPCAASHFSNCAPNQTQMKKGAWTPNSVPGCLLAAAPGQRSAKCTRFASGTASLGRASTD